MWSVRLSQVCVRTSSAFIPSKLYYLSLFSTITEADNRGQKHHPRAAYISNTTRPVLLGQDCVRTPSYRPVRGEKGYNDTSPVGENSKLLSRRSGRTAPPPAPPRDQTRPPKPPARGPLAPGAAGSNTCARTPAPGRPG